MKEKIALLAIATILLMTTASAAWEATVDINAARQSQTDTATTTLEDSIFCIPDDGNFTIELWDTNALTGIYVTYNWIKADTIGLDVNSNWMSGDADQNVASNAQGSAVIQIQAPSSEGYTYLCIHDANGIFFNSGSLTNNDRKYCEWVGIKPDSSYSKFTITSNDNNGFCKQTDYTAIPNPTFSASKGNVKFKTNADLSADTSYDNKIDITDDEIKLTVSTLQDKKATITLTNAGVTEGGFDVYRNGKKCGVCENIYSAKGGSAVWTTTKFSTYSIEKTPGRGMSQGMLDEITGKGVTQSIIPSEIPIGATKVPTGLIMVVGGILAIILIGGIYLIKK